jgi:hypothetical protein
VLVGFCFGSGGHGFDIGKFENRFGFHGARLLLMYRCPSITPLANPIPFRKRTTSLQKVSQ